MLNNYFTQWEMYVVGDLVSRFYFLLLCYTLMPIVGKIAWSEYKIDVFYVHLDVIKCDKNPESHIGKEIDNI